MVLARAIERERTVRLAGNRVGYEIKKDGALFDLRRFSQYEMEHPQIEVTEIYFRTESGNIYHLTKDGVLTSANYSRSRGRRVGTKLELELFDHDALAIGRIFIWEGNYYNAISNTRPLTEIVAVNGRLHTTAYAHRLADRYNTIIDDFRKRMAILRPGE